MINTYDKQRYDEKHPTRERKLAEIEKFRFSLINSLGLYHPLKLSMKNMKEIVIKNMYGTHPSFEINLHFNNKYGTTCMYDLYLPK